MTLKEISEIVGVSVSTVSRVINKNDTKCASKEVREKIWDAVSQTGYIPNKSAQDLRSKHTGTDTSVQTKNIACVFGRSMDINNDPFFNAIYRAIEKEAFKMGCFIKLSLSFNQLLSKHSTELINHSNIDGLIILGRCSSEHLNYICSKFKNVVMIALNSSNASIDQIICDGYDSAKKAMQYLHNLDHKEVGYIGETSEEVRFNGFLDARKEFGMSENDDYVAECPLSMEGGYNGAKKLLQNNNRPSAIFCCNDITAIGALKAINEEGLNVPKDISLISIDNVEVASYIDPMLTTINIPKDEMGKMAIRILLSRINKTHKLPIKVEFPFNIRQGDSCRDLK